MPKFQTQIPHQLPDGTVEHLFGPEIIAVNRHAAIFLMALMGYEDFLIYRVELVEMIPTGMDFVKMN